MAFSAKALSQKPFSSFPLGAPLRLLVYEHLSGGGFAEKPFAPSMLSEGFGMLRSIISDFRGAGHSATTLLDSRLAELEPPLEAERVISVSSLKEAEEAMKNVADSVDAAYIIAPESNGILEYVVACLESGGVPTLNSSAIGIRSVSDKATLNEHLKRIGLPTPKSLGLNVGDDAGDIAQIVNERIGFPAVFKPACEVGMAGLSVVRDELEIAGAVAKIIRESSNKCFLAQELVHGVPASVSLISAGDDVAAVSLNRQNVTLAPPDSASSYDGGLVPIEDPMKAEALATAKLVIAQFPGLRGYMGVDFVLTADGPFVIEVNPRLTTSYIGIREIARFNPAQAMIDAVFQGKLTTDEGTATCACFSKTKTPKPSMHAFRETFKMKEVISPPFPISSDGSAWALLASRGSTAEEAESRLQEAQNRLVNAVRFGGC